ncbi:MAG: DUF2267 domain-containing protein [Chlamydiales bacterium]
MSKRGPEVFDSTLQKTQTWLNELMHLLHWDDQQKAYLALRGTLHALRDRLPLEIVVKFGAQLPMLIRGFYYEGWKPTDSPLKMKSIQEFLDFVATHFHETSLNQKTDIERVVRAVFQLIANHIAPGEIHHIRQVLPVHLANLWPSIEYSQEQEAIRLSAKDSARHPI